MLFLHSITRVFPSELELQTDTAMGQVKDSLKKKVLYRPRFVFTVSISSCKILQYLLKQEDTTVAHEVLKLDVKRLRDVLNAKVD